MATQDKRKRRRQVTASDARTARANPTANINTAMPSSTVVGQTATLPTSTAVMDIPQTPNPTARSARTRAVAPTANINTSMPASTANVNASMPASTVSNSANYGQQSSGAPVAANAYSPEIGYFNVETNDQGKFKESGNQAEERIKRRRRQIKK